MSELIRIFDDGNGNNVVSARELYKFLEFDKAQVSRWLKTNVVNNPYFEENVDWVGFDTNVEGNKVKDYAISIDMSKKISMTSKSAKGNEIRDYFLECENIAKSNHKLPQTFSEALKLAGEQAEQIEKQQLLIAEQTPKVVAFENVIDNANTYTLDSVSDILDIGRTTLSKLLEQKKWKTIKETNGTSSTRLAEESGYAKTIYEYIKINNKDIKTKRFVLRKKGLEKLITELNK